MGRWQFQSCPVKNQVRRKRRHLSLIVSIPRDGIHVFGMVVTSTNCVERVPEHETLESRCMAQKDSAELEEP